MNEIETDFPGTGQTIVNARVHTLAENLAKLCISEKESDVSLKVNNEIILAHKSILSACSPVFCAMFKNEMPEKETGLINISDCDIEAFKAFLIYLYSGKVELKEYNVFELYKIADKYAVSELKVICIDFIIHNLSIENLSDILVFSHEFEEKKLQLFILHFFCENFKEIISSDIWESLLKANCKLVHHLLIQMSLLIQK